MAYICNICGKIYRPLRKARGPKPLVDSRHGDDELIEIDDRVATQLQKMHWYTELWRKKKSAAAAAKRRRTKKETVQ